MVRKILKRDYKYNRILINSIIMRIRYGRRKPRTVQGYKTYIFKAMKDIVEKNIQNYLNLLNGSPCRDIPEYDEILSECYIVFNKCLEKYKVSKYNDFYYYFNKALSRNFYRCYQREINFPQTELTDKIVVHPILVDYKSIDTTELLLHNLRLSEFERVVCRSKLKGEKGTEFLRKNKNITQKQYNKALNKIKEVLLQMIKDENFERWLNILT